MTDVNIIVRLWEESEMQAAWNDGRWKCKWIKTKNNVLY
jgi:hypothetical protein